MNLLAPPEDTIDTSMTEPWSVTVYSGALLDVSKLSEDDIDIGDIAHALSLQCRYNGHCRFHYSVAQHCVAVSKFVLEQTKDYRAGLAALLHDASEAYIQDIVRGCKRMMPAYIALEHNIQDRIFKRFGLPDYESFHDVIKSWDNRVLKSEVLALIRGQGRDWSGFEAVEPAPGLKITEIAPVTAEQMFLIVYQNLAEKLGL